MYQVIYKNKFIGRRARWVPLSVEVLGTILAGEWAVEKDRFPSDMEVGTILYDFSSGSARIVAEIYSDEFEPVEWNELPPVHDVTIRRCT